MSTWTYVVSAPSAAAGISADTGALAYVSDHGAIAKARLLEQFVNLPRMESFTELAVDMLQPLEDLCWQLLRERYLYAIDGFGPAVGEQLDGLGEILGEPRAGRTDDQYRLFLQIRILINVSDGLAEDLLEILGLLTTDFRRVMDLPPAHMEIWMFAATYVVDAFRAMVQAKAAGVGITFIYSLQDDGDVFKWSSQHGSEETGGTKGWSDAHGTAPLIGGKWAGGMRS